MTGAYVHVPWCTTRCPYCAFEIVTGSAPPPADRWIEGVLKDLDRWRSEFPAEIDTLYFGGGTPSRLPSTAFGPIIDAVGATDITIEANPEDLSDDWLGGVIEAGATRISLGVQSLHPRSIRVLGRDQHSPRPAIRRLQEASLSSWSVDLIFALPGQTHEELQHDLESILLFSPPHVSIYGLTIEENTGFSRLHTRRPLNIPEPEQWREMYDYIVRRLAKAGLQQYEVSNFARAGHKSRHNQLYWTHQPYLGLGPSAHGLTPTGERWKNAPWRTWQRGEPPTTELPSPKETAIDMLICCLRGDQGIPLSRLAPFLVNLRTLEMLEKQGLIRVRSDVIFLTTAGYPVSDGVIEALVRTLHQEAG